MSNTFAVRHLIAAFAAVSLVACSPPSTNEAATSELKPSAPKIDLVRAPLPTELVPLRNAAASGDAKAARSLAQWYYDPGYEFYDPQKVYDLGHLIEKSSPALGLRIRANAIERGAVGKNQETEDSLRKQAALQAALLSTAARESYAPVESIALSLLSKRALAIERNRIMKRLPLTRRMLEKMGPGPTEKQVSEIVSKLITLLWGSANSGDTEGTGHLAYWLAVVLPAFGYSDKDVMAIDIAPKILATDAAGFAKKAADLGDVRGLVALIALSKESDANLADLRKKIAGVDQLEAIKFIANLLENSEEKRFIVRKIFPEAKSDGLLFLKRSWLLKSARAGNLEAYQKLARTYLYRDEYCRYSEDDSLVGIDSEDQRARCRANFKPDGSGAQESLKDGIRVGNSESLMMAGLLYLDGTGIAQDFETGLGYLLRSARIGNPYSLAILAQLYFDGDKSVTKSGENAYLYTNLFKSVQDNYYYFLALDSEERERLKTNAQKIHSALEVSLPQDQLLEAQKLSRAWKPMMPLPVMAESDVAGFARGTGFFIDDKGGLVTAAHVVASCKKVKLADIDKIGEVIAKDSRNDIAFVKFSETPASFAKIRGDAPKVGEAVFVFGFPLGGAIATHGSITAGVVSALTGLGNDANSAQISAPVQQGNSGGPLFDSRGTVVGMVNSKLNVLKVGKATGDLPQNVNFAIKNSSLTTFLDVQSIKYTRPSWFSSVFSKNGEAVAEMAKTVTYKLACAGK